MKKLLCILLILGLCLSFAACSGGKDGGGTAAVPGGSTPAPTDAPAPDNTPADGSQPAAAPVKDEVIVAIATEPSSAWDPCQGWGIRYDPLIQSKLVKIQDDGTLLNDLATSYVASDDGMQWTFTIRNDAYFSDGVKLTAEDVAFTFNTTKEAASSIDLTMMASAEAKDETTVVFTLLRPASTFVYTCGLLGIVPAHAYGPNYVDDPIGSGAYKMVQWDKGQQLILERNENYYGEKPAIRRIVMLFMQEDSAYAAMLKGDVDVAYTTPSLALKGADGYHLVDCKTTDTHGISMVIPPAGSVDANGNPVGNAVTSDVAIRRALAYGLDREKIVEDVFLGFGEPAYGLAEGMVWYNTEITQQLSNKTVDDAIKVLEDAGWVDADGDGIREKNGVKAEFTLLYPTTDELRQMLAMAEAEQALAFGISIQPKGCSWDEIFQQMHQFPYTVANGEFTPLEFYTRVSATVAGIGYNNPGLYSNEAVEVYLDQAMAATDTADIYEAIRKAMWDGTVGASGLGDVPVVYVAKRDHLFFVRDGLSVGDQPVHSHGPGFQLLKNIVDWKWEN